MAIFVIGFDDDNGDGAFTPKSSEFTAGVYLYLRKDRESTFTLGIPSHYGKPAFPDKADFEYLM